MDKITQIFNQIRDIPYSVPLSLKETDYCCSGKHKILKKLLEDLGFNVRYRVVSFRWDLFHLPDEISKIPHENFSTHVYLEVLIGDNWLDMDVTWDPGLKNIFSVNEWNGHKNIIAVPILEKFSLKKSQKIMDNETDEEINKDLKINGEFYKKFNFWLKNNRQRNSN